MFSPPRLGFKVSALIDCSEERTTRAVEDVNDPSNNSKNTDKYNMEVVEKEIISVGVPDIVSANSDGRIADPNSSSSNITNGNPESSTMTTNMLASATISGTALGRRLHGNYRYAGILPNQPRSSSSR